MLAENIELRSMDSRGGCPHISFQWLSRHFSASLRLPHISDFSPEELNLEVLVGLEDFWGEVLAGFETGLFGDFQVVEGFLM